MSEEERSNFKAKQEILEKQMADSKENHTPTVKPVQNEDPQAKLNELRLKKEERAAAKAKETAGEQWAWAMGQSCRSD